MVNGWATAIKRKYFVFYCFFRQARRLGTVYVNNDFISTAIARTAKCCYKNPQNLEMKRHPGVEKRHPGVEKRHPGVEKRHPGVEKRLIFFNS